MGRNAELASGFHDRETYQADLEPVTAHVVAQYHNSQENPKGSSFLAYGATPVTDGYVVGGHEDVEERNLPSETITPEQYQEHRDFVRAHTKHPDVIAGTWGEDGKTVLDASTSVDGREKAKDLQVKRKQRAVWNASAGREEDLR